jgi:hypothetical protein
VWDLWWKKWHWDKFSPVSFIPPLLHYTEKRKKLINSVTELHNKPQGCGVSVAHATGPFATKKSLEICKKQINVLIFGSFLNSFKNR